MSGTIIIGLILAGVIIGIVTTLVRDQKKGKCAGCSRACSPPQSEKCGGA